RPCRPSGAAVFSLPPCGGGDGWGARRVSACSSVALPLPFPRSGVGDRAAHPGGGNVQAAAGRRPAAVPGVQVWAVRGVEEDGPHHGAQKSTRTGWADWATSACQFSDVNSTTFLLAIADSVAVGRGRGPGCPSF